MHPLLNLVGFCCGLLPAVEVGGFRSFNFDYNMPARSGFPRGNPLNYLPDPPLRAKQGPLVVHQEASFVPLSKVIQLGTQSMATGGEGIEGTPALLNAFTR